MFGSKAEDATNDKIGTIIAGDTVVEGSVIAKHAVRVDGVVNGAVRSKEAVVLGHRAVVRGGIKGSSVMAAGEVYGGIEAPKGKIEISDTGRVFGDIVAARLVIDENAVFQGNCTMTGKDAQASEEAVKVPADLEAQAEAERESARESESEDKSAEDAASEEPSESDGETEDEEDD